MATWDSLAWEIQELILSFFCQDIINNYSPLNSLDNSSFHARSLNWGEPPRSLRSFSSAQRVSRSFYHIIVESKINGESLAKLLQKAQKAKCAEIVEVVKGKTTVEVFMRHAGVFWKNPEVCEDPYAIRQIIRVLRVENLMMLLPHLEEWVLQHDNPKAVKPLFEIRRYGTFTIEGKYHPSWVVFQRVGFCNAMNAVSVKGLYEGPEAEGIFEYMRFPDKGLSALGSLELKLRSQELKLRSRERNQALVGQCPILGELGDDEWRLFMLEGDLWVLVDYRGKRMWGSGCEQKMCCWEDVWDPRSWRIGKDEAFGYSWFKLYALDFGYESEDGSGDANDTGDSEEESDDAV
jgi:hypothetical protein